MQFHIENLPCGGCVKRVTTAIHSVDADAEVWADPRSRQIEVRSDKPREAFLPALEKAGYPAAAAHDAGAAEYEAHDRA